MATRYEITSASQLDVSIRNALVDYIKTSCVSDLVTLKDYAEARYGVAMRYTAVLELVALAGVPLLAVEPEPAAMVKPKAIVRRIR